MKYSILYRALPVLALAATPSITIAQDLQSNASAYADNEDDIDSMNASYQSLFAVTDSAGADDTVYDMSFDNGGNDYQDNVQSKWTTINFTDTSAAQKLGYATNLCATQIAYTTLKSKGVALSADQEAKYERVRSKFCLLVNRAAKLQQRIAKFNDIKDNGITLFQRYAKAEPSYDGYKRTIQMGVQMQFYPFLSNICGTPNGDRMTTIDLDYCKANITQAASGITSRGINLDTLEERFVYSSWLKWSDDERVPLDVVKRLREMKGSDSGSCGNFIPIKIIYGGHVTATLYLGVDSISGSEIKLKACAVFHYSGDDKTVNIGTISFNAPFGYLGQLEAMRDKAQDAVSAKVHNKIDARVSNLIGDKTKVQSMLYTIDKMKTLMDSIKQQTS